ncbi:hypothetical protein HNP55_000674 [Paucibacter oligotrophus]|uniref:DUF2987 family protein n=1 Tax=Roseateles oligotrophus TaxID=1769250 RepID=A0A840L7Q0_9BURK|nr:DUF2987 domain-containing protein [Roseateles oligotrophus]MBB4842179.1 hypothetical protein [Roseateles oligotrophus]
MKKPLHSSTLHRPALLGGALLLSAAAFAQIPAAPAASATEQLETVKVQMQKDPAALPYAKMNEVLTKLQKVGEGLVRLDFKVEPKDPKYSGPAPKLAVVSEEQYLPITMNSEGKFALPILPAEQAKNADLATNMPKGSLGIRGQLEINVKPEDLDMGMVRRMMRVGHSLRSEMLPFYLRWLVPQLEAVRICSPRPEWELNWRENGQLMGLPLQMDAKARQPAPKDDKVLADYRCTLLSGQERWPDSAKLIAPEGSKLSVQFSR